MAISTPASGELRLALAEILVRENVRDLDDAHVDNLAQSIALRGLLVPLIVRPTDAGYELVAGYHRLAACRKIDLPDVPVVVREREGSAPTPQRRTSPASSSRRWRRPRPSRRCSTRATRRRRRAGTRLESPSSRPRGRSSSCPRSASSSSAQARSRSARSTPCSRSPTCHRRSPRRSPRRSRPARLPGRSSSTTPDGPSARPCGTPTGTRSGLTSTRSPRRDPKALRLEEDRRARCRGRAAAQAGRQVRVRTAGVPFRCLRHRSGSRRRRPHRA